MHRSLTSLSRCRHRPPASPESPVAPPTKGSRQTIQDAFRRVRTIAGFRLTTQPRASSGGISRKVSAPIRLGSSAFASAKRLGSSWASAIWRGRALQRARANCARCVDRLLLSSQYYRALASRGFPMRSRACARPHDGGTGVFTTSIPLRRATCDRTAALFSAVERAGRTSDTSVAFFFAGAALTTAP